MEKSNENQENKIGFSKKQFEDLLKLVYLGNWMANANRDGSPENPHKEGYEAIEDYIFSFAKQFGFDEYVENEEAKQGKFYPTRTLEEDTDINKLREEYNEETFWDELMARLGERDFYQHYSQDEIQKMNREERFLEHCRFEDKWEDELAKHGIERLEVKENEAETILQPSH